MHTFLGMQQLTQLLCNHRDNLFFWNPEFTYPADKNCNMFGFIPWKLNIWTSAHIQWALTFSVHATLSQIAFKEQQNHAVVG